MVKEYKKASAPVYNTKEWEPDHTEIHQKTHEKMKKLKNTVSKIKLILTLADVNIRKDKIAQLKIIE